MTFQLHTVPGQTLQSVTDDVKELLQGIKKDFPAFDYSLTIPATQPEDFGCQDPMEVRKEHPLVQSLAEGPKVASGQDGAGDIRVYKEWPGPDERVLLKNLVIAARAVAHATYKLCG